MSIPKIIFRTVPAETSAEVETYWDHIVALHPGWQHITYRDPIDPDVFPYSTTYWHACTSGAQRAGLIRLEAMIAHGGVYLDSDVELWRPIDSLLQLHGFAAWEDKNTIPDAVMGFELGHPVVPMMLAEAISKLGDGAWESGPGVTTRQLAGREDVLLLPPGSFYPVHWQDKAELNDLVVDEVPWAFGMHRWHASWPGSFQG